MKGIRKLFLGLFFVALFSAGFKVDVKAITPQVPDMALSMVNGKLEGTISVYRSFGDSPSSFPYFDKDQQADAYSESYKYTYTLNNDSATTVVVFLTSIETWDANGDPVWDWDATLDAPDGTSIKNRFDENNKYKLFSLDVSDELGEDADGNKSKTFRLSGESESAYNVVLSPNPAGYTTSTSPKTLKVTAYKVDAAAYVKDGGKIDGSSVTSNPEYALPGETVDLSVNNVADTYTWDSWTQGPRTSPSAMAGGSGTGYSEATVTDNNKGIFTVLFTPARTNFKVETKCNDERWGEILTPRVQYGDTDDSVTIEAKANTGYAFKEWLVNPQNEGSVDYPDKARAHYLIGKKDVKITARFEEISTDPHNVTVDDDKNGSGEASPSSATAGEWVKLTAYPNTGYVFDKWTTTTSGVTIKDDEFMMPDKDVTITAHFKEGSAVGIKTVKVTNGQSVNLSRYADSPDTVVGTVKATSDEVVSVSATGTKTKAGEYTIKGLKTTSSSGTKGLLVNGSQVDVIVYRTPDLYLDTSSASSVLTAEIPSSVYHDNGNTYINWDGVKKAALYFSGSKKDGKGWVYSKLTLDWQELSNRIKEVAKDSSETITITAYPVNPDDSSDVDYAVSDSIELEAYKITLDDSAGAKYTVNGKDVGDYFYAIEDVEYEVKSSAKSSGEKIQKWEHDDSLKSETVKFSAEKSRTFKAYYSNSSSSSSSSSSSRSSSSSSSTGRTSASGGSRSGGDDYDDVPKTGESKTDIWILWSVLFVSILGAGFMIWKRFGLVHAIAAAEQEEAAVIEQERIEAEEKEKQDKIDMLKDLRNL